MTRLGRAVLLACVGGALLAAPAAAERPLLLGFAGDVMLSDQDGRWSPPPALAPGVAALIGSADMFFVNLEGPLSDAGDGGKRCSGPWCHRFRMPTALADYLRSVGVRAVSTANNHAYDFGQGGVASTAAALDRAGIAHAGAAKPWAVAEAAGRRVGFMAFGHNMGLPDVRDPAAAARAVAALRPSVDLMVVSMHVGAEGAGRGRVRPGRESFIGEDRGDPVAFAHAVADAGADVVFGHGPHVLRGVEVYRGTPIFYSLGNFWTGPGISISGESGLAAVARVGFGRSGDAVCADVSGFRQVRQPAPTHVPDDTAAIAVAVLSAADFPGGAPGLPRCDSGRAAAVAAR